MAVYCKSCKCDPEHDSLPQALTKLRNCINCNSDLALAGDWTGHGLQALRDLTKKHGKEAVIAEVQRLWPPKKEKKV